MNDCTRSFWSLFKRKEYIPVNFKHDATQKHITLKIMFSIHKFSQRKKSSNFNENDKSYKEINWTSNMVLTELQFPTCKVFNLGNKGSRWKGITASDKNWQLSTINVFNSLKQNSEICRESCHISSSPRLLLRSSSSSSEICTCNMK